MYRLPYALRPALAAPFAPVVNTEGALRIARGRTVVTVGDVVTQTFLNAGIVPRVMVVDGITKRDVLFTEEMKGLPTTVITVEVESPAGEVTRALWDAVVRALSGAGPTLVRVSGEEDLAALPALLHAPDGWLVCYGQPNEGVVPVIVGPEIRARVRDILNQMEVN